MDFFESQDHALRLSRRLIALFGLAVVSMIVIVYLAVVFALGFTAGPAERIDLVHPELLAVVALGMIMVIFAGSAARTAQLRRGGPAVAELLGGRRVEASTDDPDERRLWNVVEEMAIASGTPVPAVYVLTGEPGINAFAAGHSIHDAAVAVTRGALETFDRDELQGVVAHEFSHILNGDMRLNVRLVGLLFGILLLTVVGRGFLRGAAMGGGRRRGGGGAQVAILGLVLVLLGYLGVLFGRVIQAAVSRQREYLADAAAVQFTRNPDGIAGALKKIGAHAEGSTIGDHHAQEVGHLFFADGVRGAFSSMFATHPPLEERIRRIDPAWDGRFEAEPRARPAAARRAARSPARAERDGAARVALGAAVVASAGAPGPHHVAYARELLDGLEDDVRSAVRDPEGALSVVLALLLSEEEEVRARQERLAREQVGPEAVDRASALRGAVDALGPGGRLPLLDLALPALRQLSPERRTALRRILAPLIRADGRIRTFEFALFHVLWKGLAVPDDPDPGQRRDGVSLSRIENEVELLLSAVAWAGADEEDRAASAFSAGAARLPEAKGRWQLRPRGELDLEVVDGALSRLETAKPAVRKAFLEAAVEAVRHDERARVEEVEMLRAVAEALDAPMPPVLAGAEESPSAGAGGSPSAGAGSP